MTREQIEAVLERVRTWPTSRQEEAVEMLLAMEAGGVNIYELSGEEEEEIDAALAEVKRGEVASEEEVAVVFNKYRR